MRALLFTLFVSTLAGCSMWMPRHDPAQAWIDLQPVAESELRAVAVDEKPLEDSRYFQISPGKHQLGMRYRFQVDSDHIGGESEPLQRDCRLTLDYAHFDAGARYRLVAGGYGFRPWAKLYDEHDQLLAKSRERGCGGMAAR